MIISCPHCNQMIEVIELRCRIFRCGLYKESWEQIHPHLKKEECDKLVKDKLIYGCGKPFKVIYDTILNTNYPVKCDYI